MIFMFSIAKNRTYNLQFAVEHVKKADGGSEATQATVYILLLRNVKFGDL